MKVEIEASDLLRLQTDLSECKAKLEKVAIELNQLSEEELKKKATVLAEKIFYEAMTLACGKIGFEFHVPAFRLNFESIRKALDLPAYEKPELNIEITLQFTQKLRTAFMEITKLD